MSVQGHLENKYMIRDQCQSYQMQEIPDDFYITNNDIYLLSTRIQKTSYW